MARTVRSVAVAVVFSATFFVAACATSVNHILADPSRYRNKDVTVSGRVTDSVSLAGRGAFRLEDGSGSLWVVSDVGVPRKGARVKVSGRIRDAYDLNIFAGRVGLPTGLSSGLVMQATKSRPD
jgi:hypothetical protein